VTSTSILTRSATASASRARVDWRLALGAILLLAVALRAAATGSHISLDDGYSYLVGSAGSPHAFLEQLARSENTPPLFYLLLAPLPLEQPAWLRLPAALPGVLVCAVLFVALRRPLGTRVALLAALATVVSPFLVTYSNLARGFMLEDLALLLALWAMLRLMDGARPKWWALYLVAGVVAVYSEYDAVIFLLALTAAVVWFGRRDRRRTAVLGALPVLTLIPWIPQIVHAQHFVNKTKLSPPFSSPSVVGLREATITLTFGENGGVHATAARWLEFVIIVAALIAVGFVLRRWEDRISPGGVRTLKVIAVTIGLVIIGHALAGIVGLQIFNQRYFTILIPLVATLGAAALVALDLRWLTVTAAVLLVALGIGNLIKRWGHQFEPSLVPVRAAVTALHPRTVLTDTPVVVYYLRSLSPTLDRPFNIGAGRAATCPRPCVIVDDLATRTGAPRTGVPAPGAVFAHRYGLWVVK
jgi:uncharacterized membrane protein